MPIFLFFKFSFFCILLFILDLNSSSGFSLSPFAGLLSPPEDPVVQRIQEDELLHYLPLFALSFRVIQALISPILP